IGRPSEPQVRRPARLDHPLAWLDGTATHGRRIRNRSTQKREKMWYKLSAEPQGVPHLNSDLEIHRIAIHLQRRRLAICPATPFLALPARDFRCEPWRQAFRDRV